jgi:hypothetical protein
VIRCGLTLRCCIATQFAQAGPWRSFGHRMTVVACDFKPALWLRTARQEPAGRYGADCGRPLTNSSS